MASVGGVTVTFAKLSEEENREPMLVEQMNIYHIPGIPGHAIQLLGEAGEPFRKKCFKQGTFAAWRTWTQSIKALKGQIVSIIDDETPPTTYANCLILAAYRDHIKPASDPANRFGYVWIEGVKVQ